MEKNLINFYKEIHASHTYGNTGIKRYPHILPYLKLLKPTCIPDYGCGQSILYQALEALSGVKVTRYDPAIPELSTLDHKTYDFLVNIDVLEHIPEEGINEFLAGIKKLSSNCIFIIDTKKAKTILPNGQNAHVTVKQSQWWENKLKEHFSVVIKIDMKPSSRAGFVTFPVKWYEQIYINLMTRFYKLRLTTMKRVAKKFF